MRITALVTCVVALSSIARADESAVLVIDAPADPKSANGKDTITLLNRNLPSGVPVKLQIPVPGTDPAGGSMVVWPQLTTSAPCIDPGPTSGTQQRHQIGLVTSGSGESRMLEGTIPPLQLATRYCIAVTFDRRLPTDVLNSIADVVADTPVGWRKVCALPNREDAVIEKIEATLTKQFAIYPKFSVPATRLHQAATTVVRILDVDKRCDKVIAANARVDKRTEEQKAAAASMEAVKFGDLCVTPRPTQSTTPLPKCNAMPPKVRAWPAAVVERPAAAPLVQPLVVALPGADIAAIGAALVPADGVLGASLQKLPTIEIAADRTKELERLKTMLSPKPDKPRELVLYLPTTKQYARLVLLSDPDPAVAASAFAALLTNVKTNSSLLVRQLEVMRSDDATNADAWIRLLTRLGEVNTAAEAANTALDEAETAADNVAKEAQAALKTTMQSDTIKDLLRVTSSKPVELASARAPMTDEKASWISPTVGVLVAAPLIKQSGDYGLDEGWIQPYVGASVYFRRVDRVVDLDDLVGDVFWQRNSLTIGILPNKPNVNGKDVSGPWNAAVVPYVGFGHRFTQYIRGDFGVVPFKYADANPTISDRDWGCAFWIGASLDADVWALVAGKVK